MWFYDEWKCKPVVGSNRRKLYQWHALVAWNAFIILAGLFICVAGSYGAIVGIKNQCEPPRATGVVNSQKTSRRCVQV